MQTRARLIETHVPDRPEGAVLVLHGGGSRRGNMMVSPTQLSVLRMIPIAKRIARVGDGRLAVFRLLNSVRGWDSKHTPVRDVHWALDELAQRFGERLPTCLVGHSLGGRAAILAGNARGVRSSVALAPWMYVQDGDVDLRGRRVLIVHGTKDRIARLDTAAQAAERLRRTAEVSFVQVEGGKHAMLRHHAVFDGLAAQFAAASLLGATGDPVIDRVMTGETLIEI